MTALVIEPEEAKARLHGGGEIAFLDVREAGQFGEAHPLFAVPCPYSRLELLAPGLVPNRRTPVILFDAGDGVAERAARRLAGLGYADLAIVAGGAPAWAAAGLTLFKGVNVPSKTLGELAEAVWHPATLPPETLKNWKVDGRNFCFFDARPAAEFGKMRVPGAICLPNGELAHRFAAAVPHESTPLLITCAGRTRGLTGAIGLKLAGIRNPVFALENGTQGWALAGQELERGAEARPFPALDHAALTASRERANAICERWRIPRIDPERLGRLQADESRTTYLFDVRSAEEYRAGHLPGAVHAPSGQLVQATDQWVGVRHARIVLADDTGLRAALAAFWLKQMGFEVCVLAQDGPFPPPLRGTAREGVSSTAPQAVSRISLPLVTASEAAAGMGAGSHVLLDLRPSVDHRAGHPTGALWTTRPRLGLPPSPTLPRKGGGSAPAIVLLADDPAIAELAAVDLHELRYTEVKLLDGGMEGWRAAGLPVEASPDRPSPAEAIDFLHFVHDRHDGNLESSRRYLAWEQGLVAELDPEERAEFRLEQPVAA